MNLLMRIRPNFMLISITNYTKTNLSLIWFLKMILFDQCFCAYCLINKLFLISKLFVNKRDILYHKPLVWIDGIYLTQFLLSLFFFRKLFWKTIKYSCNKCWIYLRVLIQELDYFGKCFLWVGLLVKYSKLIEFNTLISHSTHILRYLMHDLGV